MAIDWDFMEKVEGNLSTAYIPRQNGEIIQNSGVTIGMGVDLGQQSEQGLKDIGVKPQTIKLLKPYLGKSKQEAADALEESGVLSLGSASLLDLNKKIKQRYLKEIKNWYKKNNTVEQDWSDLSDKEQSVVLSVYYNAGGEKTNPKFFGAIKRDEWDKAADELRNFYTTPNNQLESRRIKELQYLVGATVDGVAERTDGEVSNTDKALSSYKKAFKDSATDVVETGAAPDATTSDMTVATVDPDTSGINTPDPVVADASSADPMGFLDNLALYLQERLNTSQGASQTPSEGSTPDDNEERASDSGISKSVRDRISSAMTTRRQAGEDKLQKTYEQAKKEERASGSEVVSLRDRLAGSDRAMQVVSSKKFNRPIPERVRTEEVPVKGESNGSKDPVFGIF